MMDANMRRKEAENSSPRIRVAIIGTGLAGLATAYLLRHDEQSRFEVALFEQGETISLDAASVTLKDDATNVKERVNIPPRSVNKGYYHNLIRMYNYLGIPLCPINYTFVFAEKASKEKAFRAGQQRAADPMAGAYFVFGGLQSLLLSARFNLRWLSQLWKILFLAACHAWFIASCFLCTPRADTIADRSCTKEEAITGESLRSYLQRIRLPQYYVDHYLLPVLSSICTCSHAELSNFPASDIVSFITKSAGQTTYLTDGVHDVQTKLVQGIPNISLRTRVTKVERVAKGVLISWERQQDERVLVSEEIFDRVVLAVTPNAAAALFKPASSSLSLIPTAQTAASIVDPLPGLLSVEAQEHAPLGKVSGKNFMAFRTAFSRTVVQTEALHFLPCGAISLTGPSSCVSEIGQVLHTAQFTRTLRTVKSQKAVQSLLCDSEATVGRLVSSSSGADDEEWVNGKDGVWLAGSWCWDGMVLLEGCVVSAMRVADAFGVTVPWRDGKLNEQAHGK